MVVVRRLALCLLLAIPALPAAAGVGSWTPLGPDGGTVYTLTADPSDPEVVYAGATLGLYKSVDGGQVWSLLRGEVGGARALGLVGDTLYVFFLDTGLLQSTDGGQTWSAPANLPLIYRLIADPRVPNRLWGLGGAVYRSDDRGATWTSVARPKGVGRRPPELTALAVDPAGPWIYVTLANGFFRSANLGKTWQPGGRIRSTGYLGHIAVDPADPAILYVDAESALFRSPDRGLHWQRIGAGPLKGSITDLLTVGGRVYASVFGSGIFHSSDHGATWIRGAGAPDSSADLEPAPGVIYAATYGYGPYRSLDGGATWERISSGIRGLGISSLAVDPSAPDVLYAGTDSVGLFRSGDRGATWQAAGLAVKRGEYLGIDGILVDPAAPSTVYAVGAFRLFRSDDGGGSWRTFPLTTGPILLAPDPRRPGALWGAGREGLFHSADRGESWTRVKVTGESDLILFELEVDPRDPRVLYAVGYQQDDFDRRLLRSADGGESWQRRDAGLKAHVVVELALDPAAPDVLYAGTEDGLFRSPDAGQTWKRLPGISDQVQALVVAPTTPTTVWVAGLYGVQRSTDGGQTWTLVGSGLEGTLVYELAVDPQDPGLLYAGTLGNSVYTYEDPQP